MAVISGSVQIGERFPIPGPWEQKTFVSIREDGGTIVLRLENGNGHRTVARMEAHVLKFVSLDLSAMARFPSPDSGTGLGLFSEEEILCLCCTPKDFPLNDPSGFQTALQDPVWNSILKTISLLSVMDS